MSILLPVRLARMQVALVAAIETVLGSSVDVVWAHQQQPREENDLCKLQLVSPPSYVNAFKDEQIFAMLPTGSSVTISGVTTGRRYWIGLNDYAYYHDLAGGEDADDVRDALIALINNPDAEETATASNGGAGKVDLSPDVPGGIHSLEVAPSDEMTIANVGTERIQVVTGQRQSIVSVQCFSHSRKMVTSAHAMISKIRTGLSLQSIHELIHEEGIAIWGIGATVDLSAIAGANFETRTQFDLTIGQRAVLTEQIETIDTVKVSLFGQEADTIPSP